MPSDYLFYEIDECEDALRDRIFYLVTAEERMDAERKLLAFVNEGRNEYSQISDLAHLRLEYAVFCTGKDICIDPDTLTSVRTMHTLP